LRYKFAFWADDLEENAKRLNPVRVSVKRGGLGNDKKSSQLCARKANLSGVVLLGGTADGPDNWRRPQ